MRNGVIVTILGLTNKNKGKNLSIIVVIVYTSVGTIKIFQNLIQYDSFLFKWRFMDLYQLSMVDEDNTNYNLI